jgi:Glutamine phosphoribosylpyrophosphate amidotransferase
MCGLAGAIVVAPELNMDDFIRDAFVVNSIRGMDSSGIGMIYTDSDTVDVHKLPINGSFFITDAYASSLISSAGKAATISICHTRHATSGNVNINNAHPFECYSQDESQLVLGAHNGTLQNWKHKKGANKFSVDSEWALQHLLQEKADAFEDFFGAFCFVWWDSTNPGQLNMARNKERPMHIAMLKSGGMAYASEAGMLHWLLERNRVATVSPIMSLDEDMLYQFPVNEPANFSKQHLPTPAVSHYATRVYKSTVDRVKELFDNSTALVPVPSGPIPKSPLVSSAQYDKAKELGVLGTRAYFSPRCMWHGVVEGTVYLQDTSMEAEVKQASHITFSYTDTWHCTIIGVKDDGAEVTIIMGPPAASDISKFSQTGTD